MASRGRQNFTSIFTVLNLPSHMTNPTVLSLFLLPFSSEGYSATQFNAINTCFVLWSENKSTNIIQFVTHLKALESWAEDARRNVFCFHSTTDPHCSMLTIFLSLCIVFWPWSWLLKKFVVNLRCWLLLSFFIARNEHEFLSNQLVNWESLWRLFWQSMKKLLSALHNDLAEPVVPYNS